ncbi:kinase-like domain-containing protein [Xylariaceae sp. FL0255]|nr:kinase-like domain-containing protein [Xylariaceae sp. FL0255]
MATKARQALEEVQEYFSGYPRYKFEKEAGKGAQGIAVCFSDTGENQNGWKKFIVKVQYSKGDLEKEAGHLQRLRWAKHIVSIFKLDPNPFTLPHLTASPFQRPYIFQEYLENGTLSDLADRYSMLRGGRLPNRILWAVFFCLVRSITALAYPPGDPNIGPRYPSEKLSETVPLDTNSYPAGSLVHGDIHTKNIMFGEIERPSFNPQHPRPIFEHERIPIVKLIDFGSAKNMRFEEVAYEVGLSWRYDIILDLAAKKKAEEARNSRVDLPAEPNSDIQPDTIGQHGWDNPFVFTNAPYARSYATGFNIGIIGAVMTSLITDDPDVWSALLARPVMLEFMNQRRNSGLDPNLDEDLLELVARCIANEPTNRPELSQLLSLLQGYMYMKTEQAYPGNNDETDANIDSVLQEFMFDVS